MRSLLLFLCSFSFLQSGYCQSSKKTNNKPPVDTSVFGRWPTLGPPSISGDGNYILYEIVKGSKSLLVVKSIKSKWEKQFEGVSDCHFTADGKRIIIKTASDSLQVWRLGSNLKSSIPNVDEYAYSRNGKDDWISYREINNKKQLKLRCLTSDKEFKYPDAKESMFSNNGKSFFVKIQKEGKDMSEILLYVNLSIGIEKEIWTGIGSSNYLFDPTGLALAFIVNKGEAENEIWYYNEKGGPATLRVCHKTSGVGQNLFVANRSLKFSKDGSKIFFSLQEKDFRKADPDAAKVDIWHHSEQLHSSQPTGPKIYLAVINNDQGDVIRLEREDEKVMGQPDGNSDFVLIEDKASLRGEKDWNEAARRSVYLASTKNNSRIKILDKTINFHFFLSPDSKYIIYYDFEQKAYFSINLDRQVSKNITSSIPFSLSNEGYNDFSMSWQHPVGIGGWMKSGEKLFPIIYDDYDVWIVDPEGKKSPINFTKGFGRSHNIKFRLVYEKDYWNKNKDIIHSQGESLLLTAFNTITKDNGFYSASLKVKGDPALLTMGPFNYYHITSQSPNVQSLGWQMQPLKALNKNIWIVRRGSSTLSPNYFVTQDFKSFTLVSSVYPERSYNWLTTELHQWESPGGKLLQGILYKPENFDSSKKYPVIFYYYEKQSDGLNIYGHIYDEPQASRGPINIPYFVSNGYLVFAPDIYYTIGVPGESALSSVTSAAKYLSKHSWIDTAKMGLQGHSFGGYETNYIITHTNLFAAAAEASGHTDLISGYGALQAGGSARWLFDIFIFRIKATLWERPDLYIKNSPIFNVPNITTPLLIMHNKGDIIVPWSQAVEMFNAMHRLRKKVWMLQYDDGNHGAGTQKNAVDYTIRLAQFFDHYLKGKPAPKWMTQGIPARLKQVITDYELDPSGNCGKDSIAIDCKVCKMWNETMKKDKAATMN